MANQHGNSGSGGPNMRWGHGAAPDGSWAYSWGAGSVPGGGPTFGYGSGSARSDGRGSGFGFGWGASAAGSGSGSNQHGSDQPYMHMPHYWASFYSGMPFSHFPMGPMFGPPRPPRGTDDHSGRGRGRGGRNTHNNH